MIDIENYWGCVVRQEEDNLRSFFEKDAVIDWKNTKETFNVEEFIQANCKYPGNWDYKIERCEQKESSAVTVVRIWKKDYSAAFHVVSFFECNYEKIERLEEYWGEDGVAPEWRRKMHLADRSIFFHEDDFCQIELLPKGNLDWCRKQMKEIENFKEDSQTGEAIEGFTDLFVRKAVKKELQAQEISSEELAGLLALLLPEYDRVETGYSDYREECRFTRAFGENGGIIVFFDSSEGMVQNLWLECEIYDEQQKETAKEVVSALGMRYQLILADWNWLKIVELENSEEVINYMEQRLKRGLEINEIFHSENKEKEEKPEREKEIMFPLWLKFRWISRYSIGWRMGGGEDYKYQWGDWMDSLTEEEQTEYIKQFPEPSSWKGFWKEFLDDEEEEEPVQEGYYNKFHSVSFWNKNGVPSYALPELLTELRQGIQKTYLFFWRSESEKNGNITKSCLSQWWKSNFQIDTVTYCCMEQYMMAEKARLFGDTDIEKKILDCKDPKTIKALGRKVSGFDETTWNTCRYSIVLNGNYYKFLQNAKLWEFLNGTGNQVLVEASPRDRIWGIGIGEKNEFANSPEKWRGTNLLGFALMEVREELRKVLGGIGRLDILDQAE